MVFAMMSEPRQVVRFTPPPFDENAVSGVPALTAADGYNAIDAQAYIFSLCGELRAENGSTDVYLTNHAQNDAWLKLVMRDSADKLLGETGLIRAGEYVQSMHLDNVPAESSEVKLVIMGYEPETYYSVGNVTLYTMLAVPPQPNQVQ